MRKRDTIFAGVIGGQKNKGPQMARHGCLAVFFPFSLIVHDTSLCNSISNSLVLKIASVSLCSMMSCVRARPGVKGDGWCRQMNPE